MKITLLTILCFISFKIHSQDLKKYNGEYKNGKASYQYFENENYERKYQGTFRYEKDEINFNTVVLGNFQNNVKNGEWYYKRFHKHSANSLIILGNYENGRKNGTWSYNQISEATLNKDDIEQKIYFIELKEDTLINNFYLKNVNGQFNNKGHFFGKWTASEGDYEFIAEFKRNTLIKLIERKLSTGKIISKYIPQNIQWESEVFYTKFTEDKIDVYGLETEYDKKKEQIRSINRFFKLINKEFNPFNSYNYVFLQNTNINLPKFIFKNKEQKKEKELRQKAIIIESTENKYLEQNSESNYNLAGRKVLSKPKEEKKCQDSGIVTVRITVDKNGKVISAISGVKGTTNSAPCLLENAKKSALKTIWNSDNSAPKKQTGIIIYKY